MNSVPVTFRKQDGGLLLTISKTNYFFRFREDSKSGSSKAERYGELLSFAKAFAANLTQDASQLDAATSSVLKKRQRGNTSRRGHRRQNVDRVFQNNPKTSPAISATAAAAEAACIATHEMAQAALVASSSSPASTAAPAAADSSAVQADYIRARKDVRAAGAAALAAYQAAVGARSRNGTMDAYDAAKANLAAKVDACRAAKAAALAANGAAVSPPVVAVPLSAPDRPDSAPAAATPSSVLDRPDSAPAIADPARNSADAAPASVSPPVVAVSLSAPDRSDSDPAAAAEAPRIATHERAPAAPGAHTASSSVSASAAPVDRSSSSAGLDVGSVADVASSSASSAPTAKKGSGAAKFMQRNWRSIAIGVGVVAVVSLVALAVIFGVPAPVAGLTASIWQGAGSIASEGWETFSWLLRGV